MAKPENRQAVRNAADPEQVKKAGEKDVSRREQELNDIEFILSTAQGKRFLWRLMGHCSTFESIWEPSAKIHYLSGKQDVGHFLMAEIVEARPDALIEMMKESSRQPT